jgi:hypothetical protein
VLTRAKQAMHFFAPPRPTCLLELALFELLGTNQPEKVIAFTDEQFFRDPTACLEQLISAGLVYCDDGLYLGLPICENYRKPQAAWDRMRI